MISGAGAGGGNSANDLAIKPALAKGNIKVVVLLHGKNIENILKKIVH